MNFRISFKTIFWSLLRSLDLLMNVCCIVQNVSMHVWIISSEKLLSNVFWALRHGWWSKVHPRRKHSLAIYGTVNPEPPSNFFLNILFLFSVIILLFHAPPSNKIQHRPIRALPNFLFLLQSRFQLSFMFCS